jgi:hypothetical protein
VTGYQDPVKAGYTDYHQKYEKAVKLSSATVTGKSATKSTRSSKTTTTVFAPANKKYVRGSSELTTTTRGYEPAGTGYGDYVRSKGRTNAITPRTSTGDKSSVTPSYEGSMSKRSTGSGDYKRKSDVVSPKTSTRGTTNKGTYQRKTTTTSRGGSSDYYQRKSGTSYRKTSPGSSYKGTTNSGKRSTSGKTYTRPKTSTSSKSGTSNRGYRSTKNSPRSSGSRSSGSTKSSTRSKTSTTKKSGGKR